MALSPRKMLVVFALFVLFSIVSGQNRNFTEEERNVLKIWKNAEKSLGKGIGGVIKSLLPMGLRLISEVRLSGECQSALMKWIFGVQKLKTWAFDLIDAMGKPVPGILYGTLAMYGDYEQCLNVVAKERNKELFTGSYCPIELIPKLPPKPDLVLIQKPMQLFKEFAEEKDTIVRFFAKYAQLLYSFRFRYDICIPSKCSLEDITSVINYAQQQIDIVNISVPWCDVKEEFKLDTAHYVCSYAIAILVIIVLVGTAWDFLRDYDVFRKLICNKEGKYLLALSIRTTSKRLVEKVKDPKIGALHGMRFISCLLLIFINTLLTFDLEIFSGMFNLLTMPEWTSAEILLHASVYVETFFLLSGIMVMYSNIPKDEIHEGKFNVISYICRRLFRLVPPYLFLMACMIVLPNSAAGPLWTQVVKREAQYCRDVWWKNILFVNNFIVPTEKMCLKHSWYMAVDFQLYLIALIVLSLIIVWRSKIWAVFTAVGLSLAGIISVGIITFLYNYTATILISNLDAENINNYRDNILHMPHDHIASYSLGLGLGYLFVTKPNLKISIPVQLFGWAISTAIWSSILFGIDPWNRGNLPNSSLSSVFAATHRLAWCMAISWIAAMCYYGYGGKINTILSNRVFVFLSRLSYMAFLGFTIGYSFVFGYYRVHVYISRIDLVFFAVSYLVFLYVAAYVFYVMIDGPTLELKKLLFYHPLSEKENINKLEVNGVDTKTRTNDVKPKYDNTSISMVLSKHPHQCKEEFNKSFTYRL